jgi:hypothetical protein
MADDLTLGELARSLKRVEEEQRDLARLLAESNRAMVPAKLHEALQNALTEHIRVAGIDHDRLERAIDTQRTAQERLRDDLDKEIEQARTENRTQIAAIKAEREKRTEFTWQRVVGLLTAAVALAGVIVAALAASKGIH